jgi:hypothetical protein
MRASWRRGGGAIVLAALLAGPSAANARAEAPTLTVAACAAEVVDAAALHAQLALELAGGDAAVRVELRCRGAGALRLTLVRAGGRRQSRELVLDDTPMARRPRVIALAAVELERRLSAMPARARAASLPSTSTASSAARQQPAPASASTAPAPASAKRTLAPADATESLVAAKAESSVARVAPSPASADTASPQATGRAQADPTVAALPAALAVASPLVDLVAPPPPPRLQRARPVLRVAGYALWGATGALTVASSALFLAALLQHGPTGSVADLDTDPAKDAVGSKLAIAAAAAFAGATVVSGLTLTTTPAGGPRRRSWRLPLALATVTLACAGIGTGLFAASYGIPPQPQATGNQRLNVAYSAFAVYGLAGLSLVATTLTTFDWLDDRHRPLRVSLAMRQDGAGLALWGTF